MRTDAELVASARSGDREGLSEIYDRYGDRLYDLCTSVVRDPDLAFDTTVDTFVLAALELYRLRQPDKLEVWLFALARQQLLIREIPMGVDEHAEFDGTSASAAADGAGAIVWEAVSWFPGRDRVLLDLHARQPLDDIALSDVMGVSLPHAVALVRDVDERMRRLLSALLVARLARPGCAHMKKLIASEDEHHPDTWLRHTAQHVGVCRTCLLWREDQPDPINLISGIPAESAPPEVRAEVVDRVDLLWSALGPPEWTAAVLGEVPPPDTTADFSATAPGDDAETEALDPTATDDRDVAGSADTTEESPAITAVTDETADAYDEREYEGYDEVESLVPPPPRLRRSGFPRSMYPGRRRLVQFGVLAVAAVIVAAGVMNFRGFGQPTRSFAAEAKAAAPEKPPPSTAPPTSAPPTTAPAPDTRPPLVGDLATVYGCIGPRQTSTTAYASVVDAPPGHVASVELVFNDPSQGEQHRRMTESSGRYVGPIGPYTADGTITWQVVATDDANNQAAQPGPAVAASSTC
jgi:DNA-directed RNA polymerase specialized sigma24 family protein